MTESRRRTGRARSPGLDARSDLLRALPAVLAPAALAPGGEPLGRVAGLLALLGLLLTAHRLAGLRSTPPADRVLVGVGGAMVALVLTGLLLGATPPGLSRTTWVWALLVLTLAGLGAARVIAPRAGAARPRPPRRARVAAAGWVAAAIVVTGLAVHASADSLTAVDAAPVEVSAQVLPSDGVEVRVSSGVATGPLVLRARVGGELTTWPAFELAAGQSAVFELPPTTAGRTVVTVRYPGESSSIRSLVLNR